VKQLERLESKLVSFLGPARKNPIDRPDKKR